MPEEHVICSVWVGDIILVESPSGTPEEVVEQVRAKIKGMSQRMKALLDNGNGTPPSA